VEQTPPTTPRMAFLESSCGTRTDGARSACTATAFFRHVSVHSGLSGSGEQRSLRSRVPRPDRSAAV
jgi:hypothetical protein